MAFLGLSSDWWAYLFSSWVLQLKSKMKPSEETISDLLCQDTSSKEACFDYGVCAFIGYGPRLLGLLGFHLGVAVHISIPKQQEHHFRPLKSSKVLGKKIIEHSQHGFGLYTIALYLKMNAVAWICYIMV